MSQFITTRMHVYKHCQTKTHRMSVTNNSNIKQNVLFHPFNIHNYLSMQDVKLLSGVRFKHSNRQHAYGYRSI